MSSMRSHINEERTMHNGQRAKIIGGRLTNLSVEFDDGTRVDGVIYRDFKNGYVKNPTQSWINAHIGEEQIMNNGQKAVIRGGKSTSLIIEFEDGTVIDTATYATFKKGSISNPSVTWKALHKGNILKIKNGMNVKIVDGEYDNLEIEFEDGTRLTGVNYSSLKRGKVKHPTLRLRGSNVEKECALGIFRVDKISFRDRRDKSVYYECRCRACGFNGILTPQEMLVHRCSTTKNGQKEN